MSADIENRAQAMCNPQELRKLFLRHAKQDTRVPVRL